MTIWLHIGLVKTGTTTLQSFLAENSEALLEQGLDYPTPRIGGPPGTTHYNLALELRRHPRFKPGGATWQQIIDRAHENPDRSMVISAESFQHLASHPEMIEDLAKRLRGFETRVICYLRSPADLAESWYIQKCKTGHTRTSLELFLERTRDELRFTRLLDPWEVFGRDRIVVRMFERAQMVNGDLIDDFLHVIGAKTRDSGLYREIERHNESPGCLSLALAEMVASSLTSTSEPQEESVRRPRAQMRQRNGRAMHVDVLRDESILKIGNEIWPQQEKARLMSPTQKRDYNELFQDDHAEVIARYLPGRDGPLFTSDSDTIGANYTDFRAALATAEPADLIRAIETVMTRLARFGVLSIT